jgi:hypothetical protein
VLQEVAAARADLQKRQEATDASEASALRDLAAAAERLQVQCTLHHAHDMGTWH